MGISEFWWTLTLFVVVNVGVIAYAVYDLSRTQGRSKARATLGIWLLVLDIPVLLLVLLFALSWARAL